MDGNVTLFLELLETATARLPAEYFRLKVAGSDFPQFRERVYCYELYHQLRSIWPPDYPFSLSGEVDKSGHPILRGGLLDRLKPDFLVHSPGRFEGDLIVVEVKPITATAQDTARDLASLNRFVTGAGYQLPILLVFGGSEAEIAAFKSHVLHAAEADPEARPSGIHLRWHSQPGTPAIHIQW